MSHLFPNYGRRPIEIVEGKGTMVKDATGKEYYDFSSGIAVVSLGHANDKIVQAIQEQSEKLWHISNLFESSGQEKLAKSLVKDTHLQYGFFCNSGAEANEAAMKLARKHTGRDTIITFTNSFHGRTFGGIAATGQDKVKEGFGPLLQKFITVPYNDCEALEEVANEEVAAIMLEVVQGEGGVTPVTEEFVACIQKLCEQHDILLILDEVQTGIGRTGTMYAFEQTDFQPDIVTLAKGLGGGFPIGAMLGVEKLGATFGPGTHGTTFGGNPLAVAVAQTVVDTIKDDTFLQDVRNKSTYFHQQLKKALPQVEVKGWGFLVGLVVGDRLQDIVIQLEEKGVLTVPASQGVLRLLPPLTVTKEEVKVVVEIVADVIMNMEEK